MLNLRRVLVKSILEAATNTTKCNENIFLSMLDRGINGKNLVSSTPPAAAAAAVHFGSFGT